MSKESEISDMGRIKKIIYFLDFPFFVGGASKVLLTQAYIMKRRGFQVKVVIPNNKQGKHEKEYDKICTNYGLETMSETYSVFANLETVDILESLNECRLLIRLLKDFEPDFIHSTQLNISLELAARELGIPHLMNIYQVDVDLFHIKWIELHPLYHSADSLLFSERWKKGLGIPSKCVRVAYEKRIDERGNNYLSKNDDVTNLLSIGILSERKNQLEIIKFVYECKKRQQKVKLVILGYCNTTYGKKCKNFVEQNDLQDDVIFEGFVLNIEYYMKNADLFIMASTVESYPGVIVESMANKVPIIATAVAGVPELLKDGENGFLSAGSDSNDIYAAYLRYMDFCSNGKILQIIENAYFTYLNHHTYTIVGEQLEDYYCWIIDDYHKKNKRSLKENDIRQIFESFRYEFDIEDNLNIICRLWFVYHLILTLEQKDHLNLVIWGAGLWGSIAYKWFKYLKCNFRFLGFIDIKKKGYYLGYPILQDIRSAITESNAIVVALEDDKSKLEVINYLEKFGKIRNKDYFLTCNFSEPIKI